jgi:hypothetical protein
MLWKPGTIWVGYKFDYDGLSRLKSGLGISVNTNRETISEYDTTRNLSDLLSLISGLIW